MDAGIVEGSIVDARFDPMLAKIVAAGPDRPAALAHLAAALDRTTVLGLTTNLRFLRWLVRSPAVVDGEARIDTLERIWPPPDAGDHMNDLPDDAWQAAARLLATTTAGGGWRMNAAPSLRISTEDGRQRTIAVQDPGPGSDRLAVLGADRSAHVDVDGRSVAFELADVPDADRNTGPVGGPHGGIALEITAPMPGSVLAVHRSVGETVESGDPLVTLEAMKMEHVVTALAPGVVLQIRVRPSDQVQARPGARGPGVTDGPSRVTLRVSQGGPMTKTLPSTREELLGLHADARARRAAAPLGGEAYREACQDLATIEVRIAEVEIAASAGVSKG